MRSSILALLFFVAVGNVHGTNPVSAEDFKQTTDASKRLQMIVEAPPEQQQELKKINRHLLLLESWGGETGLANLRKSIAAQMRGVTAPLTLIIVQNQIWDNYVGNTIIANEKLNMSREQQTEALIPLRAEHTIIGRQISIVRDVIFDLAPSPQALALNKRAQELIDRLQKRDEPGHRLSLTKKQLDLIGNEISDIVRSLDDLPKLTPEQVQKESDAIPENQLPYRKFD